MVRKFKNFLIKKVFGRMYLQTIVIYLNWKRVKNKVSINGKDYDYLFHSYNNMGVTERSIEIPVVYHYLTDSKFKAVLEIGNVTNYYQDYYAGVFPNKTVVDKIEHDYNVITSDIANYRPGVKYDFIFSISTFEHMDSDLGRNPDYKPGVSKYCSVAADNIVYCYENLLMQNGTMLITAPLGYTPEWDLTFKGDFLETYPFKKMTRLLFKRVTEQEWVQVQEFDLKSEMRYNDPFPYANYVSAILIKN